MRIVADRDIAAVATAFAAFGDVELVAGRTLTAARLHDADALLVRSVTRVDAELLGGTAVRFVGTATAGTDHVAVDYLNERGIAFAAAPGCNARAVAEHVVACVLAHLEVAGRDPAGLAAGVVGYGHTGTAATAALRQLGLTCKLNDPPRAATDREQAYVPLAEALDADVVTLHVPLTEDGPHRTRNLIEARALRLMRPGALLINTARGGVVNERDLLEVLDRGRGVRAAVDCWQGEPVIDRGLLQRAFVATPHIAGHSVEARFNATALLHQALARHLGRAPCWQPRVPPPAALRLVLPEGSNTRLGLLAEAVFASHDPRRATASLKRAAALPPARAGRYFDRVRRPFGRRREFAHYVIASAGLTPDTVSTLQALGFHTGLHRTLRAQQP